MDGTKVLDLLLPHDTLGYQLARPFCVARDVSGLTLTSCADRHRKLSVGMKKIAPETAALTFYLLDHAVALIRSRYEKDQSLPQRELEVLDLYHELGSPLALRMYLYLAQICLREARHDDDVQATSVRMAQHGFHPNTTAYFSNFAPGNGYDPFRKHAISLGDYARGLEFIFLNGKWGPAYGGPKWAEIAKALRCFVTGELSPAMLLDRSFYLAHNTAPIFNKGHVFEQQNHQTLGVVLDTQAAGEIPYLIANHSNVLTQAGSDPGLSESHPVFEKVRFLFEPLREVDWFKVSACSKSSMDYSHLKKAQAKQKGIPLSKLEHEEKKLALEKKKGALKTTWSIHSGLKFQKIHRPAEGSK